MTTGTDRYGGFDDIDEVRRVRERLERKGYRLLASPSGECGRDELGHYHAPVVAVRLTASQARRLAR